MRIEFQILFAEANHIFKDRLTKYEDKKIFEEIIHEIFTDNHLNFKNEGDNILYKNLLTIGQLNLLYKPIYTS